MLIPEKTYTDNPFVDNIIYYAKYLALNCTVKDDDEAMQYETIESLKNAELLISSIEEVSNYDEYSYIPKEILEKYIEVNTNLNLFLDDIENLKMYLSSINSDERFNIENRLNIISRNVYIDHYNIFMHYISTLENQSINDWIINNEALYNNCKSESIQCNNSLLFNAIPQYTKTRIIKTYISNISNDDLENVSANINTFNTYLAQYNISNTIKNDISSAMRSVFISHYETMQKKKDVAISYEKMKSFQNYSSIYELAKNNNISFLNLMRYFSENEIINIITNKFSEEEIIQNNLIDGSTENASLNVDNLISYLYNIEQERINDLDYEFAQVYIQNYRAYIDYTIYSRCMDGIINFYEIFEYIPKETQKMILNSQIEEYTNIQLFSENKNLLDSYLDTLSSNESIQIKNNITIDMRKWYPSHHKELNNYYRVFAGLPPIDSNGNVYEDTLLQSYDENTGTYIKFGNKFINKMLEISKLFPEIHWKQNIYEFTDYDISILNEYGILDEYVAECNSSMNNIRYRYLKYLGANKLDIYQCRKANRFQLIGLPSIADEDALKKFTDIYSLNRDFCLHNVFSEAHKIRSDYYNKFIIIFILINTIMDMLSEISSLIINKQIFDSRCIQWIFESYGVPFYGDIPLKYLKIMLKNLNNLLKYKSSVKNMIDICKLFGFNDIRILNYYLFKQRNIDGKQYVIDPKDNKIDYDINDIYIKIDPKKFLNYNLSIMNICNNVEYDDESHSYLIPTDIFSSNYDIYIDYNGISYMKLVKYIKYSEKIEIPYDILDIDDVIDAVEIDAGSKIYDIGAKELYTNITMNNIYAIDLDTNKVINFDAISYDPMIYYNIFGDEIESYDPKWELRDSEKINIYYECLDKYTERIAYVIDDNNVRYKKIIKNDEDLYIMDPVYMDFIKIKDLEYFKELHINSNPVKLKFIKIPEGELLNNYKNNQMYFVDYDEITCNDEGDTWDGGQDHNELYSNLCNKEFTTVKTKYISLEALTDLTEQSFQISYFYNMLFDNLYSEDSLLLDIPYMEANHKFKFIDIICYLFSLMYLYNGVVDNIMYSPTQIMYIKNKNLNTEKILSYEDNFSNYKINAFNLKANIESLRDEVKKYGGYDLKEYVVDDRDPDNIITVDDFFSLNNSKYRVDICGDLSNISVKPINEEIKVGYDLITYKKIYKNFQNDKIHSYILSNSNEYIEIIENDSTLYLLEGSKYVSIPEELNNLQNQLYSVYYLYTLRGNNYIKDAYTAYYYINGKYKLLYNLQEISIVDSNNRCIFSSPSIYEYKNNGYVEIDTNNDNYFESINGGGKRLIFGEYWEYDKYDNIYKLNKDYAYIKVYTNGVAHYERWIDVINHQELLIPENECYIKHGSGNNVHFVNFIETDYFITSHPEGIIDTNIGDKIFDYCPETLFVVTSEITDDYEDKDGQRIYYKELKIYYDENKWIYTDDLYIKYKKRDNSIIYIPETELINPSNCYFYTNGEYKLVINNLYKYETINDFVIDGQIKRPYNIIICQNNNEYELYTRNSNGNYIKNNELTNSSYNLTYIDNVKYIYNSDQDYITGITKNLNYTNTISILFNRKINNKINSTILEKYNPEETDNIWDENDWYYENPDFYSNNTLGMSGENIWYYRDPSNPIDNNINISFNNEGCGFYLYNYLISNDQIIENDKYHMSFDIETNFSAKIQIYNEADNSISDFNSRSYDIIKGKKTHISQIFTAKSNTDNITHYPKIKFVIYDLDSYPIEIGNYIIIKNINLVKGNNDFIPEDILSYKDLLKMYNTNKAIHDYLIKSMINESDINKYKIYKMMYDSLMVSEYNKEIFKLSNNEYAKTYTDFLETRDTILYLRLLRYKNMNETILQREISDEVNEIVYILDNYLKSDNIKLIYTHFPGTTSDNIQTYILKIINWFKSWKVHLLGMNNKYNLSNKYENFVSIKYDFHYNTEYEDLRNSVYIYDTYRYDDNSESSYRDNVPIIDRIRIIDSTANTIEYRNSCKDIHIILNDINNRVYINDLDLYISAAYDGFSTNNANIIIDTNRTDQDAIYGQFIDEINLFTNDYIELEENINE